MSYRAEEELREGEKRLLYGEEKAVGGALLTVTDPGKFTLYDDEAAIVSSFNGVAVSGYTTDPSAIVQSWYNFDSLGLPTGVYVGIVEFKFESDQDGEERRSRSAIIITILPNVEIIATYDRNNPTSPKDRVRRAVADTDVSRPIWSDGEINAYLQENDSNPFLAGAAMLEDAATDFARQAKIIALGTDRWDRTRIPDQLRESAKALRAKSPAKAYVTSNEKIFTFGNTADDTVGTMDDW
jgi:hypothetical protein